MSDTFKGSIGIVGSGYVGSAIGTVLRERGYTPIVYSLEPKYIRNTPAFDADIIFVCVPTPTTNGEQSTAIVEEVLGKITNPNATVVIKSTVLPGTTRRLAAKCNLTYMIHWPEFLSAATAVEDTRNPVLTVIGSLNDATHVCSSWSDGSVRYGRANELISLLPCAETFIVDAELAEVIKYFHNIHAAWKILLTNIMFNVVEGAVQGDALASFNTIKEILKGDRYIGAYYMDPVIDGGRGAGGACFVKDVSAFAGHYLMLTGDSFGDELLRAAEQFNLQLLRASNKDPHIVNQVYGN